MPYICNIHTQFYAMRFASLPILNLLKPESSYSVCKVSGQTYLRPLRYRRNTHYLPRYMQTDNGMFLPSQYCKDNDIGCIDEEKNMFNAGDENIKFSNSCGWYNSDEFVVYDGCLYDVEEMVEDYSGKMIPVGDATWCEREDEYVHSSDVVECVYVRSWDETETVYTRSCNTWRFNGDYFHDDSSYSHCPECEDIVPDSEQHREHGEYCSSRCEEQHNTDSLTRYEYHTDVRQKKGFGTPYLKIKGLPVYTGIELECYVNDGSFDEANEFIDSCGYAIPTRDGSLSCENGVEYVFRPESMKNQIANVRDFVSNNGDNLYEDATNENDDNETYGLHIHVSSHFLSNLDKIKIVTFANKYLHMITDIGKRDAFGYAKSRDVHLSKRHLELSYDRYQLVNTTPAHTIEYRFPKSIVTVRHIGLNIQLCWAMTMYCAYHCSFTSLKSNKALEGFKQYVKDNAKEYELLFKHFYPQAAQQLKDAKQAKFDKYNQKKAA